MSLLSHADRAVARLDGSVQLLPAPDLFVAMYVKKEAVLSSQIEGTQSSLANLLEAEAELFSSNPPDDVKEVINYVAAMTVGLERLDTLPVSVRLIREIHATLMTGVRGGQRDPGELRRIQNWIGPANASITDASFVPPPPADVPTALHDLETFIHDARDIPTLIKIGLVHAQFETIHPFLDGNGRVGRLLVTLLLCEQGILTRPVLYLSHDLRQHRSRYYELLQRIRDNGDWESWLKFFLTAVASVSREATATSRRIVDLRERHRDVIVSRLGKGAANGIKLLETLYSRPVISVKRVQQVTGTTFAASNTLVRRFVELGILEETTGQSRNRVFRYGAYIGLFSGR